LRGEVTGWTCLARSSPTAGAPSLTDYVPPSNTASPRLLLFHGLLCR
jgi:hypothetical protein